MTQTTPIPELPNVSVQLHAVCVGVGEAVRFSGIDLETGAPTTVTVTSGFASATPGTDRRYAASGLVLRLTFEQLSHAR